MSRSQPELFKLDKPERARLNRFKSEHGVLTYRAKTYTLPEPWSAWISWPPDDPEGRSFMQLVEKYSVDACFRRRLIAHAATELEACRKLAELNGWELP